MSADLPNLITDLAALCAVFAIGFALPFMLGKKQPEKREAEPIIEWRPTLRMDARAETRIEESEDETIPANWVLRTQEIRLVRSVSGEPHAELRWRPSTRREVKDLIAAYHKARGEEITARAKALGSPELPERFAVAEGS